MAGCKYQRYFGKQEVSGGPVNLVIITPDGITKASSSLDILRRFKNPNTQCPACGRPMRATEELTLSGRHLLYLTKCPHCLESEYCGIVYPGDSTVMKDKNITRIELDPSVWKITGLTPVEMESLIRIIDLVADPNLSQYYTPEFNEAVKNVRGLRDTLWAQLMNHNAALLLADA